MPGLVAVFRKELADHFGSGRFTILFALIIIAGLGATYAAAQAIRRDISEAGVDPVFVFLRLYTVSSGVPSFVQFLSFLGPLVGLALGFDAINSEHARRTLSRVLSQPIYRDSLINGKFLAGMTTITAMLLCTMLLLAGLGLSLIGIAPTGEEMTRLGLFFLLSVIYVALWMGVAVFFSILFRQTATSALASIALWIVVTFFLGIFVSLIANAVAPVSDQSPPDEILENARTQRALSRLSPGFLYGEATTTLLSPNPRTIASLLLEDPAVIRMAPRMLLSPLPVEQSLLLVLPQVLTLIGLTLVAFVASYLKFLREEIRAS